MINQPADASDRRSMNFVRTVPGAVLNDVLVGNGHELVIHFLDFFFLSKPLGIR